MVYLGILAFALVAILLLINMGNASADTVVDSDIDTDTEWNETGSPYIVEADISVVDGATLNVTNDTTVKFDEDTGIAVENGTLNVLGSEDGPAIFTKNYNDNVTDWWGIQFDGTEADGAMENFIMEFGETIDIGGGAAPTISHAQIWNSSDGLQWTVPSGDATVDISDFEVINNSYNAMTFTVSEGAFTGKFNDLIIEGIGERGLEVIANHSATITVENALINDTFDTAIHAHSENGSVDATLEEVIVSHVESGNGVYLLSDEGSGSLKAIDTFLNDTGWFGIDLEANNTIDGNLIGVIINGTVLDSVSAHSTEGSIHWNMTDVEILNVTGTDRDGVLLTTDHGDQIVFSATNLTIENMPDYGLGIMAPEGRVNATLHNVTGNEIGGPGALIGANNTVDLNVEQITLTEVGGTGIGATSDVGDIYAELMQAEMVDVGGNGVNFWAPGGSVWLYAMDAVIDGADTGLWNEANNSIAIAMDSVYINGTSGDAVYAYSWNGQVDLTVTGGTINNTEGTGIYLESHNGSVMATSQETWFGANEMSLSANSPTKDVDLWIEECSFMGDYSSSVEVNAGDDADLGMVNNTMNGSGIYAQECNLTAHDNVISNSQYGIELDEVTGTVSDNTISDCETGIHAGDSTDLGIVFNSIATTVDADYGVDLDDGCVNVTVAENAISGHSVGISVYDSEMCSVIGNEVSEASDAGISVDSDEIEIADNTVSGSEDGIVIEDSEYVKVENNTISEIEEDGVYLNDVSYIIVGNNTIENCMMDGLGTSTVSDLILYNGVFADNGMGVYAPSGSMSWVIDDQAEVRNNPVEFNGDITVADGGEFDLDFVESFIGMPSLTVEDGGTMIASNVNDFDGDSTWHFVVEGTMHMDNSVVSDARELYIGPNSTVEMNACVVDGSYLNGIHVDNSSPEIASTEIVGANKSGVFIEGEDAAPIIKDCIIAGNERGIYAHQSSLGQVVDNLIMDNSMAGIYAEEVDGGVHDNILMFNDREVYLKDSTVNVTDNQIGYSTMIEVMMEYWPLYYGIMPSDGSTVDGWMFTPEDLKDLMSNHIGVYADNSTVTATGNTYGMLSKAVYVVDSDLTFSDSVEMNTLVIPYFDDASVIRNITLPIYVYDGISASNSDVTVEGASIEVLDDAIFLDGSTATVRDTELNATDFDIYAMEGSTVECYGCNTTIKAEDSSDVVMYQTLTIQTVDRDGDPMGDVYVAVFDASGEKVDDGSTDSNGEFTTTVQSANWTSSGEDTSMNPYTVSADFDDEAVNSTVQADGTTNVTLEEPKDVMESEPIIAFGVIAAVLIGVILIALAAKP
ncbi:MAG: right-handed parallel beta-helix repeat-containing protein [Methanomassiliicoccales archaeon]